MRTSAKPQANDRTPWQRARRVALALAILAALLFCFPDTRSTSRFESFREGEIAPARVVAPFDFDVPKPEEVLAKERRLAKEDVPSYFRFDDGVQPRVLARFHAYRDQLEEIAARTGGDSLAARLDVERLGVSLSDRSQRALLTSAERRGRVLRAARELLDEVLIAGVASPEAAERIHASVRHMLWKTDGFTPASLRETVVTPDRIERMVQERVRARLQQDLAAAEAFRGIVKAFLEPNVVYDREETARIEAAKTALVNPVARRVLHDEMIVDSHQRISPDAHQALQALSKELAARRGTQERLRGVSRWGGRALLNAALLLLCVVYLRAHRPRVYRSTEKLVLVTVTMLVVLVSAMVVTHAFHQPWLVIPVAAGSMVISLLIDAQLGVFFTLIVVVFIALNGKLGLDFVSYALVGGLSGVYSVERVRHRTEVFRALLLVAAAHVFVVLALGMARGEVGLWVLRDASWALVNAGVSTAIAVFLIPILEMTCRVTTDLTLLELSDLNRPLLKRLMLEAPGTYHHSMVMGTLAEGACESVGANSLLGRVQCYYHDIGKLTKPEYFAENMMLNPVSRNPHDRLTPSMSRLILESHVREGVELAREHKLPEPLIDAIREHHGTSEMSFFLEKAKALDPGVDPRDFRYPGPKPRSKEAAIVMLADGVEAASRALVDPSSSRIRGLVARAIDSRVQAGELEECGLTLADLTKIREAFTLVLTGIFHGRVRYPARADVSREVVAVEAPAEPERGGPPVESGAGEDTDLHHTGRTSAGAGD